MMHREKTAERPAGAAVFSATTETHDAYPAHDVQPRHAPRAPEPVQGPRFDAQTTYQASFTEKSLPQRGPRADTSSYQSTSKGAFTATTSNQNDFPADARYNVTPLQEPSPAPYMPSSEKLQATTTYQDMLQWMRLETPEDALGVETIGGAFHQIVPGELSRPLKRDQAFTTVSDDQTEVTVKVLQQERGGEARIKCLGEMDLGGLPPRPEGEVKILVTFDIDAAGVLNVGATLMMDIDRAKRRDGPSEKVAIRLR